MYFEIILSQSCVGPDEGMILDSIKVVMLCNLDPEIECLYCEQLDTLTLVEVGSFYKEAELKFEHTEWMLSYGYLLVPDEDSLEINIKSILFGVRTDGKGSKVVPKKVFCFRNIILPFYVNSKCWAELR